MASNPPADQPRADELGTSYRVLMHLARQGRYGPDEVPPKGFSQAGMVEALGLTQGALVGILQRFVAAGVLSVERSHVRGVDRRVKVYRLTLQGESVVQEIRRRQAPAPGPFSLPPR
ncbi:MAG: MarR family winged helix-turn-helix transcriptional regulator [Thermoplasmata archaeon]|nr:MarR family winged helix-turn-helix transcriptional regulator [Thermoplasmata archaeon]